MTNDIIQPQSEQDKGIAKGLNPDITFKEYLEFEINNLQKALEEENQRIALEKKQ